MIESTLLNDESKSESCIKRFLSKLSKEQRTNLVLDDDVEQNILIVGHDTRKKRSRVGDSDHIEKRGRKRKSDSLDTAIVKVEEKGKKRGRKPASQKVEERELGESLQDVVPKKRKRRQKVKYITTKSIYTEESIPYDNDTLPNVRFPLDYSVPDHLLKEFMRMFPKGNTVTPKKKKSLEPQKETGARESEFLNWMRKYWTPEKLNILVNIILKRNTEVTFTLMDWLCTNFSKNMDSHYALNDNDPFDFYIHESYEQNLEVFYRPCFDAFARKQGVMIEYVDSTNSVPVIEDPESLDIQWDTKMMVGGRKMKDKNMIYLVTSVGQLIFFHWAMTNRVLDFCEDHAAAIRHHMEKGKKRPPPETGKRRKLSEAASSSWMCKKVDVILRYDKKTRSILAIQEEPNTNRASEENNTISNQL